MGPTIPTLETGITTAQLPFGDKAARSFVLGAPGRQPLVDGTAMRTVG
jgi:hypothetical protein